MNADYFEQCWNCQDSKFNIMSGTLHCQHENSSPQLCPIDGTVIERLTHSNNQQNKKRAFRHQWRNEIEK